MKVRAQDVTPNACGTHQPKPPLHVVLLVQRACAINQKAESESESGWLGGRMFLWQRNVTNSHVSSRSSKNHSAWKALSCAPRLANRRRSRIEGLPSWNRPRPERPHVQLLARSGSLSSPPAPAPTTVISGCCPTPPTNRHRPRCRSPHGARLVPCMACLADTASIHPAPFTRPAVCSTAGLAAPIPVTCSSRYLLRQMFGGRSG